MSPNHSMSNKIIQLSAKEFVAIIGLLFSAVVGGTAWTVNLQNQIVRRLDESISFREFLLWQQALRQGNPTMNIPQMETFHGALRGRIQKQAVLVDSGKQIGSY